MFRQCLRFLEVSNSSRCTPGKSPLKRRLQVWSRKTWLFNMLSLVLNITITFLQQFNSGACCQNRNVVLCATPPRTRDAVLLLGFRKKEVKKLRTVLYIQNGNTSLTNIAPVIATVLTFILHTSLRLKLNTADVSSAAVQHTLPSCPLREVY